MIFLRHHLHEGLKIEYLTIKDLVDLWKSLKERYDHQKTVILPKARYDWIHLRLQDFKTQQYREKGFKKFSKLISCLLVAEENNKLLMKNHESRPTGSAPFPEVNATSFRNFGRGRNHGRGKCRHNYRSRGGYTNYYSNNKNTHQKWMNSEEIHEKDKGGQKNMDIHLVKSKINDEDICLIDSATTHTIFKDKKYFSRLIMEEANTIRLDNAGEFTSQAFNEYCMSIEINVEQSVSHVHTQNGLVESLIKCLKLIARLLLMKFKLPISAWGHAILHATSLEPNISHLRIFGCAVYVPIAPPQRTKMGPQRRTLNRRFIHCKLPDAFTNLQRVTKSHIPAANALIRIDVGQSVVVNESKTCQKRGRPIDGQEEETKTLEETPDIISEEIQVLEISENEEISINYFMTGKRWNRNEINVDYNFAYNVALNIMKENEDLEPTFIEECRYRNDWPMWKDAIKVELNSLAKREVFGPVVRTPNDVKLVGYKWVFVRKRNEKDEIVRYKARLVAQSFTQKPSIDYEETYSPVGDAITF
ncbi:Reverse transcriptase [Theobroma cacao]|nr:Reverse transcriptase [Theobroma cacao]